MVGRVDIDGLQGFGPCNEAERGEGVVEVLPKGRDVSQCGLADEILLVSCDTWSVVERSLTWSQNCLLAPCCLIALQASKAATSVSRSERARANDSRAFRASSRLSIGEVNSGFDDKMAAMVTTGHISCVTEDNRVRARVTHEDRGI